MAEQFYADANATTPVLPEAYERMREFFGPEYGNPSSPAHELGRRARAAVENARAEVAGLIGAKPAEIVFTGGGTESCFLGIAGGALARKAHVKLVYSAAEHSAVIETMSFLEEEIGLDRTEISLQRDGTLNSREAHDELEEGGAIASFMLANNETGVLFPVAHLARTAKSFSFHTDATQAVGKIEVSVAELGVDFLSFSGHKFGAPKGVGALYIREGVPFRPVMPGGGQEGGRRGGTENVPFIVGMGEAAKIAGRNLERELHPSAVRDSFEKKLKETLTGFSITGEEVERLPNTTHLVIEGIIGSELILRLSERGIICSTGSACHSGKIEPSHVLMAMGLKTSESLGAIRFSFLSGASSADALEAAGVVSEVIPGMRKNQAQTLSGLIR